MANYNKSNKFSFESQMASARVKRTGFKGDYYTVFSKHYKELTDQEVDLRQEYGKSLIGRFLQTNTSLINLKLLTYNQTSTTLNEVYGVRLTKVAYGKLSIRVQITPRGYDMYFVLQRKFHRAQVESTKRATRKDDGLDSKYRKKLNGRARSRRRN